jgi:hypothetical protein
MFILVALICVLNDSDRGHECNAFVYPDEFLKVEDCRAFKFRQAMYVLPREKSKLAMGDCVYRHTETYTM